MMATQDTFQLIHDRFDTFEARIDKRFDAIDKRFDEGFDASDKNFDKHFDAFDKRFDEQRVEMLWQTGLIIGVIVLSTVLKMLFLYM